jgi:DNA polymerase-3 subunit gamma/tau
VEPQHGSEPSADRTSGRALRVDAATWGEFAESDVLTGLIKELAMNLEFKHADDKKIHLRLQQTLAHLMNRGRSEVLARLAGERFGAPLELRIEVHDGSSEVETPSVQRERRLQSEREAAEAGFLNDPEISTLIDQFDAELVPGSVQPAKHRGK